ncbi:MAG: conjugative transposon protein TraM [Lutibacter sp.]|nr:conjugative transposon protein TraM [Lutibacter sp.]
MTLLHKNDATYIDSKQIPIPELENETEVYNSKLDAINALKDVRETNAPSIYDERLLDSTGVYDPDLLDNEKMRIVDSIYNQGRINYIENNYRSLKPKSIEIPIKLTIDSVIPEIAQTISAEQLGLEHSLFFAAEPVLNDTFGDSKNNQMIYAAVNGDQIVETFSRLEMRLTNPAFINNELLPKNTYLYGFVSFKPNRTLIHITNINHKPVSLIAYDLQDGNEGIYVVNNFQSEASKAVVDDAIDEINIPSIPSIGVLKKVFQRSNKNVKVTITNNYQLLLKPKVSAAN